MDNLNSLYPGSLATKQSELLAKLLENVTKVRDETKKDQQEIQQRNEQKNWEQFQKYADSLYGEMRKP